MTYRIEFFPNRSKERAAVELRSLLSEAGWTEGDPDAAEFIFIVGGDGSFFHFARQYAFRAKKLVGIRAGNVSFSLDFPTVPNLERLRSAEWRILELLEVRGASGDRPMLAMNDVLIRGKLLLTADVSVDGERLERFRGSGLLFATRYGSTAMNKSIGGPLLLRDGLWIMNGVGTCSTSRNRSLGSPVVLDASSGVRLHLPSRRSFTVFLDGRRMVGYGQKDLNISLIRGTSRVLKIEVGDYIRKIRDIFLA